MSKFSLCVFIFITAYVPVYAQNSTQLQIQSVIDSSRAKNAFWSISVRDSSGRKLIKLNDQKFINPGSNLKLFTSAAVLYTLGPHYRFKTYMYGNGQQKDSTWVGDIYVVGSGDPSIDGNFYNGDRLRVFEEFYNKLDSLGITGLKGYLIGNDSYFDNKMYPDGWNWNQLSSAERPEIDALSFNDNCIDVTINAKGNVGNVPKLTWFPFNTDFVHIINEQNIIPDDAPSEITYKRVLGTNTVILSSNISENQVQKVSITISNPAHYFIDSFKKFLTINGFKCSGNEIVDNLSHNWKDTTRFRELAVHYSRPAGTLLRMINKNNNNFYAEMMLKAAAAKAYGVKGTTNLGIELVGDYLSRLGIDTSKVELTDASGISDHTLAETSLITKLLMKLRHQPNFTVYKNSLSEASIDGTLEDRFQNSPLQTKAVGMAARNDNDAAFSGYLTTKRDSTLIFSIVTNHLKGNWKRVNAIQNKILSILYNRY